MRKSFDQEIIDYLTLRVMRDIKFLANPHCRVRSAWLEAKRMFNKMDDNQKMRISLIIRKN